MKKSHSEHLVFGLHSVRHVLQHAPTQVLELWLLQDRHDERLNAVLDSARTHGIAIQMVPKKTLDKLAEGGNHQGVVLRSRVLPQVPLEQLLPSLDTPRLLLLDGVQDPHNLGACLRTANAAGVHAVIAPKDRACGLSPTVRKVACGAVDHTPFYSVTNLAQTMRWLRQQDVWLVGLDGDSSHSLYQARLTGALGLVLGAEGTGLRRLTRENCDELVHLPMLGQVESLNVSVATGISLYEVVRQA